MCCGQADKALKSAKKDDRAAKLEAKKAVVRRLTEKGGRGHMKWMDRERKSLVADVSRPLGWDCVWCVKEAKLRAATAQKVKAEKLVADKRKAIDKADKVRRSIACLPYGAAVR